jgi:hypothetical protein
VVFLVHFSPLIGSPAVSLSISLWIASITAGVFFHRLAPATQGPHPVRFHILGQQLPSPLGYRVWVQTKKFGDLAITA